jgi:hypothetical protein
MRRSCVCGVTSWCCMLGWAGHQSACQHPPKVTRPPRSLPNMLPVNYRARGDYAAPLYASNRKALHIPVYCHAMNGNDTSNEASTLFAARLGAVKIVALISRGVGSIRI